MYGKISLDIFDVLENEFDDNLSAELNRLYEQTESEDVRVVVRDTLMNILLEHKCMNGKVCLLQEYYYLDNNLLDNK